MLAKSLPVFAAALRLAVALPAYELPTTLPSVLLEDDDCVLPEAFIIEQFQMWTPATGNNHSALINFAYWDSSTDLQTICRLNATSQSVAKPGRAPRYACDNADVEFIWQNTTLTVIERACPQSQTTSKFEASGAVTPALTCVVTLDNSSVGHGDDCLSKTPFIPANFTSLEPSAQ